MTAPEAIQQAIQANDRAERSGRRRPFSAWMKKLTNFKGSSSNIDSNQAASTKRNTYQMKSNSKKSVQSKNNNPYPESGHVNGKSVAPTNGHSSFSTVPTGLSASNSSCSRRHSARFSEDGHSPPTIGNKSAAATISTSIARSEAANSHAPSSGEATSGTIDGGVGSGRGADSTFSSPAPSIRSLTTTLTTIHSAAPPTTQPSQNSANTHHNQSIHFSHQFPASPPPNALPAHLAPQTQGSGGHPLTYNTATANNLLTDNASILTLASSSKRRRRRSMDTDASVRALAPSSLFGGSRESLPLSVLSANIDPSMTTSAPHQPRASVALNERASIYSAAGIAPALPSERSSFYAGKQSTAADGGSSKSGFLGHGRQDSISGSIAGIGASSSPLASPRDANGSTAPGKLNQGSSGWAEEDDKGDVDTETESKDTKEKENGKAT